MALFKFIPNENFKTIETNEEELQAMAEEDYGVEDIPSGKARSLVGGATKFSIDRITANTRFGANNLIESYNTNSSQIMLAGQTPIE